MKLNKSIYQKQNIILAISAYKEIANIKVHENENYWILDFYNCMYEKQKTELEFENYLIGLEN